MKVNPKYDAWTTALQVKNEAYDELLRQEKMIKSIEEILRPVLQILEEHDIPVSLLWWETYFKAIELKEEAELTPEAAMKIVKKLNAKVSTSVTGKDLDSRFICPFGDFSIPFSIHSKPRGCRVVKTVKTVTIPERTEEQVSYELDGPCEQIEALMEVKGNE